MSRPFSSPLMVEFISKVKGLESKPEMATREWARQMESQYGHELVGDPSCIDLPQHEWDETYKQIEIIKQQFNIDVIATFPRPQHDLHVRAVNAYMRTIPIAQCREARIEPGSMNEQFRWQNWLNTHGANVSFEDWAAIRLAYGRTQPRTHLEVSPVQQDSLLFVTLPHGWTSKLKRILSKTDHSEVVASYEQVEITRGDVARIVPEATPQTVTPGNDRGWLNDTVVHTFLKIIAAASNKHSGYTRIVVVNSFVLNLKATNPQASAKKAGIDASTLSTIEMVFFPLHSANHWKLAVAFPKTRSIVLYDSLRTADQKELLTVRDWLKNGVGEAENVEWNMKLGDCPQQGDASLCGVFVCLNAWCVSAGGKPVEIYSPAHGPQLREYIAAIICKGSVPFVGGIP